MVFYLSSWNNETVVSPLLCERSTGYRKRSSPPELSVSFFSFFFTPLRPLFLEPTSTVRIQLTGSATPEATRKEKRICVHVLVSHFSTLSFVLAPFLAFPAGVCVRVVISSFHSHFFHLLSPTPCFPHCPAFFTLSDRPRLHLFTLISDQ